jgi:gamma-butyrobetaine dioxygenase
MKILNVTNDTDHLLIDISGNARRYHYLWLRDNCPASRSRNGQRLHESNSIDPDIRPTSFDHSDQELNIVWNDDTTSAYPVEFLKKWAYDIPGAAEGKVILWRGQLGDRIRQHDYAAVCADSAARRNWLADVELYGFSLLRDVPLVEETIFDVVGLFGFVRETNYGRLFEVRTEKIPTNLAYTPVPLSVHTDNPYRDPCPTLQLLHCLVQSAEGGITALVDGIEAAVRLRQEDPAAFELLSKNDVSFHYEADDACLDSSGPIITLDASGKPRRIRINNRSMTPLHFDFDMTMPFYKAVFRFRSLLEDESSQHQFRMQAGDLIVFDNERILHGRVGEAIGARHLQGCYADRDGLLSTLRVLETHGD